MCVYIYIYTCIQERTFRLLHATNMSGAKKRWRSLARRQKWWIWPVRIWVRSSDHSKMLVVTAYPSKNEEIQIYSYKENRDDTPQKRIYGKFINEKKTLITWSWRMRCLQTNTIRAFKSKVWRISSHLCQNLSQPWDHHTVNITGHPSGGKKTLKHWWTFRPQQKCQQGADIQDQQWMCMSHGRWLAPWWR